MRYAPPAGRTATATGPRLLAAADSAQRPIRSSSLFLVDQTGGRGSRFCALPDQDGGPVSLSDLRGGGQCSISVPRRTRQDLKAVTRLPPVEFQQAIQLPTSASRTGRRPSHAVGLRGEVSLLSFCASRYPGCTAQACGVRDHRTTTAAAAVSARRIADPSSGSRSRRVRSRFSRCCAATSSRSPRRTACGWQKSIYGRNTWATSARRSSISPIERFRTFCGRSNFRRARPTRARASGPDRRVLRRRHESVRNDRAAQGDSASPHHLWRHA